MAVGDIELKLTIDGKDFTSSVHYMVIENSIFSPLGSGAVCNLIDAGDKTSKFKGGEKVVVTVSNPNSSGQNFKYNFQLQKGNASGNDIKNKRTELIFRTKEWYTAQGNPISESFNDKPENVCKKIFKDYLKSDKTFEIKAPSKVTKRIVMGSINAIKGVNMTHDYYVPQEGISPSVLYHTQSGTEKIVFTNWQKLFEGSVSTKLKQTMNNLTDARVSDDVKANSLYDLQMPQLFTRDSRQLTQVNQQASCLITNRHYDTTVKTEKPDGLPGKQIYTKPADQDKQITTTAMNPVNEKNGKTYESEGKANKKAYIAHLLQNEVSFKVPFNSKINIGSMVDLDIPRKQNDSSQETENQINSKVLITDCSIIIKPIGQSPRCHMEVRAIKASYDKGDGGNG